MVNKQIQEAGDNSHQFQANNMAFYVGVDEKRAREIYHEMHQKSIEDNTIEARRIADSRIQELKNILMPKMEKLEGALNAFADPGFQLLLVQAQKAAAATEREKDYNLLSELLIDRFRRGDNRIIRTGISRAIEIVDLISDEALLGLTLFYSVIEFRPRSGFLQQGLNILDKMFGNLFYANLPEGIVWIDHLDILNTVRINSFSSLKSLEDIYSNNLSGYVDVGIKKNSEKHEKANKMLRNNCIHEGMLVDHELNPDYVRLLLSNTNDVDNLLHYIGNAEGKIVAIPYSEDQKNVIRDIYDLYEQNENIRRQNVIRFMDEWNNYTNLIRLRQWWNTIKIGFQITSVGRVLAHSNAQRCDPTLPSLNN